VLAVYLDLVMGLNFLVDLLLLLGTNRLAGFPMGGKRCVLAALLGAVYSGICLLPGFSFLGNSFWRLVCLGLMGSIAFGWNPGALRRTMVFILLSMALGGLAVSFGRGDFVALILSGGMVWLLCHLGFGGNFGQTYVPVEISFEEKTVKVLALRDTGNTLRDPVTGERVLVIGADAAERLTGLRPNQLAHPVETAAMHVGYRLIPYHAVGQPGGMLLAKRFENVSIGEQSGPALVAFAPEIIGRGAVYQALAY
jgi:stage II sporulation protein GA (sporulation sigma-E factor processing peptidase)